MEKIIHPTIKKFSPVTLYLEDIEKIILILKEENFTGIKIKTNENVYNDDEIEKIKDEEIILKIFSYNPFYFLINFGEELIRGGRIYVENDSSIALGSVQKVGALLTSKRRFFTNGWCFFTLLYVPVLTAFFLESRGVISSKLLFLVVFVVSVTNLIMCLIYSGKKSKRNLFFFKRKVDVPNYWMRTKDKIITSLITAILTVIITTPITIFITKTLTQSQVECKNSVK